MRMRKLQVKTFAIRYQDRRGQWRDKDVRAHSAHEAFKKAVGDILYPITLSSWGQFTEVASFQYLDGYERTAIVTREVY